MQVKLDRFGRVVLPKTVRDDLDLEAGEVLVMEEVDERILLRPVRDEPTPVEKDGVLVFTGEPMVDIGGSLEKLRARRLKGLAERKPRRR